MTDTYTALVERLKMQIEADQVIRDLTAENARLRDALRQCRRAVAGGADEPRRTVREIVDHAIEERERKLLQEKKS